MIYAESSVLASLVMRDFNSGNAIELTASQDVAYFFNHLLKLEVARNERQRCG